MTEVLLQSQHITQTGMGQTMLVCGFGLLLGMRHATDADHLVALSTIVTRQRSVKRAALIGSVWGIGHTTTIFCVGSLIILFHIHIPVRLGLSMEFCVAVMLVILGLLNLTGWAQHVSLHLQTAHKGIRPVRFAATQHTAGLHEPDTSSAVAQYVRPLVIGLVHGLAGSAAVALLVMTTIRSPIWAALYLLVFGLGTVLGMMLMTTAIALPLAYGSRRFSQLNRRLVTASGIVSLCFGLLLVYQLGFAGGLFTGHPHWTPQ